jgi:predicted RNase H-like nuclease (RuvC/YqgF family)
MSEVRNGNGRQSSVVVNNVAAWLGITIAVLTSIGTAFWTVANPRDDIKLVRDEIHQSEDRQRSDFGAIIHRLDEEVRDRDSSVRIYVDKNFDRIDKELLTRETLREHETFVKSVDNLFMNLRSELDKVRADQVSRSEHIEHWREIDAQISNLRASITSLRDDYTKTYSAGDQIKNLQDQITELRKTITMGVTGHIMDVTGPTTK